METYTMEQIMSNLYGPTATQMMGGGKKTKGGVENYETVGYPEYCQDEECKMFMESFYLIKYFSNAYKDNVFVIPPKEKLKKMINDFLKELEKNNIQPRSKEAFKFAVTNDLPYKKYIFSRRVNKNDNYSLHETYKNFGVVTRMNKASEIYYFKYLNDTEIEICTTKECTKGKKAKLLCVCENGVLIFKGDLPENPEILTEEKAVEVKTNNLKGGSESDVNDILNQKIEYFLKSVTNEDEANNFVASFALSEYEKNPNDAIKKYSKLLSGNPIHTAFRIVFDNKIDFVPTAKYKNKDKHKILKMLIEEYEPINKNFDVYKYKTMFKDNYKNIAFENLTPLESSSRYKKMLINKYNKIGIDLLKADIATAMYKNGENIETIFRLTNALEGENVEEEDISRFEYSNSNDKSYKTSKYNYLINKAILSAPLIGITSKQYIPILKSEIKYKSVFKKEKAFKGGLDETKPTEEVNLTEEEILKRTLSEDEELEAFF